MASQSPLRALTCPNCGAPMDFPEDQRTVRCAFCNSIIDRSDDAPTHDDEVQALKINIANGRVTVEQPRGQPSQARHYTIKMGGGQPMMVEDSWPVSQPIISTTSYTATSARPSARGGGCGVWVALIVVGLVVLAAVAIPILSMSQVTSVFRSIFSGDLGEALTAVPTLGSRILVQGSLALVPALGDAPPDIVALTTQYPTSGGDGEKRLVALSGAEPKLLWQSEALDKDTYDAPIAANHEYVYTVTGTRLLAFKRTDGTKAWEATLADAVQLSLCSDCLRVVDDYVAVLTDDGTLQVFDAGTGRTAWFINANQDSPRGLHLINGQLAFLDNDEDGDGILRVFDPATGDEGPVTQPTCERESGGSDNIYWYTPISIAPNGSDFYFTYGFPEVCLQRFDGQTLDMTWEAVIDYAIGSIDTPLLVTPDDVFLSFDNAIFAVDAATGESRNLVEDEGYDLRALAVHDKLLLVLAVRTRGSQRYELWALDKDSGEQVWDVDFGEEAPFETNPGIISDGASVWTWHPSTAGLVIVHFYAAEDDVSHAAILETLDWTNGETNGQKNIRLGLNTIILSAPEVAGWTQDTLWYSIEETMMALDTAKGEVIYRWP